MKKKQGIRKLTLQANRIRELTIEHLPAVGGAQLAGPSKIACALGSDCCGAGGTGTTH